ncbi:MAG TPA: hypothetical protein VEY07_03150 [Thermoplasmata archaeon]|nr:hypothetical protein [Thermoplasmata archaeon]
MKPVDRELMEGMGNCYAACGANFDETVRMVSSSRDRTPEDVVQTLRRLRSESGSTEEYLRLRARFPADFPV